MVALRSWYQSLLHFCVWNVTHSLIDYQSSYNQIRISNACDKDYPEDATAISEH